MDKIYSFIPRRTLALIVILSVAIGILGLTLFLNQSKQIPQPPPPIISQPPTPISPLQKSVIGKTSVEDFEKLYPEAKEQVLANGDLKYSILSTMESRPNEVVFRKNVAGFERIILVGNQREANYLKLSDQILKYGPAERVIRGSKFYGYRIETHIYATEGFVFIVNPFADEIYEIQTFTPAFVENYLNQYGEDVSYSEGKEVKE